MPLVEHLEQALADLSLSQAGLVVAISGGADSTALACALAALRRRTPGGPLILAHVNHQLRGAESDNDEAFVRHLHAHLVAQGTPDLRLHCQRIDVNAAAQAECANQEAVARRLRYHALATVAKEKEICLVATAHTANDQAETVLHRLLRGTGWRGLRGIARRRPLDDEIEVIRPLLNVGRADILTYLEGERQSFRMDASNDDLRRTRNRIRHRLLPLLASEYNPAIVSILGRLAEQAEGRSRAIQDEAEALRCRAELPRAGTLLIFDRAILASAPRPLVREMVRQVWMQEGWPVGDMTFAHWDRLAGVVRGELSAADLPADIRADCRARVVRLGRHQ